MKTRILSGVLGFALLAVLLLLPPIAATVAMALLCMGAVWEAMRAVGLQNRLGQLIASLLLAATVPFWPMLAAWQPLSVYLIALCYLLAMGILQVIEHQAITIEQTAYVVLMTVLPSLSFSCLAYLRGEEHGRYALLLALLIPWMADIGAYFVGVFFGRHKLCPLISPKKTVEGLLGGFAGALLYGGVSLLIYQKIVGALWVNYGLVLVLSLVGAALSVFGDLFASVIKRQHGIKDFGNLIPGHGGVLDRFDSLLFATPVIYVALHFFSLAA